MRPKIVILILLAGLAGVTGIILIKHRGSPPPAAPITVAKTKPATPQTAPTITAVPPHAPAPVAAAPTPEQQQAAIDAEKDRLEQWSMNDDTASLSNILVDLTNPDKEIRMAAIEGTEQFGSTNAIPILKNLAAHNEDPEEKAALIEAANFIALPSLELVRPTPQQKAERAARRQAQNQNSSAAPNN
jgi:hypothetical protein